MVCSIRTPRRIHTSTKRANMPNLMNELANMRITDTGNINNNIIRVNNQL